MSTVQRRANADRAGPARPKPRGEKCNQEEKSSEMYRGSRARALCPASAVGYREIVNVKSEGIYGIWSQFHEFMQVRGLQAGPLLREPGGMYMQKGISEGCFC